MTLSDLERRWSTFESRRRWLDWAAAALDLTGRELFAARVPGRIELFGKHTDYAGGHSILVAADRGFLVVAAGSDRDRVRVREDDVRFAPLDLPTNGHGPPPPGGWQNYVQTVIDRLAVNFPSHLEGSGADIALHSDLPVASGMSGSSALMIAVAAATISCAGISKSELFTNEIGTLEDLAVYLACLENGMSFRGLAGGAGVGTFGGSEDHLAIVAAQMGTAFLAGFDPARIQRRVTWPQSFGLVVSFSGVTAEKTGGAQQRYNRVSALARQALAEVNASGGTATGDPVFFANLAAAVAARSELKLSSQELTDRVAQLRLEELELIPAAMAALQAGDGETFGALANRSHAASRLLLGNIVDEVHVLQGSAVALGAWGASGFGAGFGGSVYAVLPVARCDEFLASWQADYRRRFPAAASQAAFFVVRPADGVTIETDLGTESWGDWLLDRRVPGELPPTVTP